MNTNWSDKNLHKNKKYYSYSVQKKDKENIYSGTMQSRVFELARHYPPSHFSSKPSSSFSKNNSLFLKNTPNFFQKDQFYAMKRKQLRKEIILCIHKICQPSHPKPSIYQEYLALTQETTDYLQYYLANFGGKENTAISEIIKDEAQIILLIIRKTFDCLKKNPPDIVNRILLSFQINPLNDFQFIGWEKFQKMRKLMIGNATKQEWTMFILDYLFTSSEWISGANLWAIFSSVIRKLECVVNGPTLNCLITRIVEEGQTLVKEDQHVSKEQMKKVILDDPLWIWKEFVMLIFI